MSAITFQYWSDPLCIWAYVAQPKLEAILDAFGDRISVDYHIVPVFGSVPWRFREGPWSERGPEGRVEATARVASQHGFPEVTGECWLGDCPASSWTAGAAVKAVFAMESAGEVPEGRGAAYQLAMRHGFFLEHINVARRDKLLLLAERCGVPLEPFAARLDDGSAMALLHEDFRQKEAMRIQGSPTYVFDGGRAMLYGNVSPKVLRATVSELIAGLDSGGSDC